jgi:hypothetical protein
VHPLDTSPDAAELLEESYRRIGMAGRLRIALELSDLTHAFAVSGIRWRNPELSDEEARRVLAERLYGSVKTP